MDSLDALDESLDDLETVLASLFDKSFPETLEKLDLLQRAKLQVLIPYVVNDLIFVFLKTRGINPKTHPVIGELDRIKQYFDKIKSGEDPEQRRFAVDQGAATRFIKHAIKESEAMQQRQRESGQGTHIRFADTGTVAGDQATTGIPEAALLKIQEREAALRRDGESSEEQDLEVFAEPVSSKPVGKTTDVDGPLEGTSKGKKRRGMDPWAGYDETTPTPTTSTTTNQEHMRKRSPDTTQDNGDLQTAGIVSEVQSEFRSNEPKSEDVSVVSAARPGKPKRKKSKIIAGQGAQPPLPDASEAQQRKVMDAEVLEHSPSRTALDLQGKKKKRKKVEHIAQHT